MFATSEDYHQLNAGAHRNSPQNLNAPALTWHLAFWLEKDSPTREEAKTRLDNYLLTLCRALKADDTGAIETNSIRLTPYVSDRLLLFNTVADKTSFTKIKPQLSQRQINILNSSNRAVSLRFRWHSVYITIRVEMHTEYFSITTFAWLSQTNNSPPFSTLVDLENKINDGMAYFNNAVIDKNDQSRKATSLNRYFFNEFWNQYSSYILSYSDVSDIYIKEHDVGGIFNKAVFADFRGLILSGFARTFEDEDFFRDNKAPTWGDNAKRLLLPLLKAPNIIRLREYECAINYLLDGRALYMSTLAPQIPEESTTDRIPLEFIVYVHQRDPHNNKKPIVNKWQLGRLISQLHLLGTLRLAALKDTTSLHDAGRSLSDLDPIAQNARELVAKDDEQALAEIRNVHERFNEITANFVKQARIGLQYRIERSRYYVAQFLANAKLLRIVRLEGDQPYDQFVQRRLGPEFDFINRLGTRYERAVNNLLLMDENYEAIRANQLTGQNNRLVEQNNNIEVDIRDIQRYGEFALLAAFVPYYLTAILSHIIQESYVPIMTVGTWTVFVTAACYRLLRSAAGYGVIRSVVYSAIMLAIVVPCWFGLMKYSKLLRFPVAEKKESTELMELLDLQKKQFSVLTEQLQVLKNLEEQRVELQKKQDFPPVRPTPKHEKHFSQ